MNAYNQEEIIISCPYCGATITSLIDYSSTSQEYYEDCSVCCAPVLYILKRSEINNDVQVEVRREDD